ncbi:MAG TPA: hypothetical protein VNV88_04590 [Candidatus Solibacter sp.]|nr:hypothetical protein [Candidatus Solibacter sp.]
MKNALIRIMTIAMLATSMSTFAMSENTKAAKNTNRDNNTNTHETAVPCIVNQQKSGRDEGQSDKDKRKARERQQMIQQEDREWLHDLQGIYGG